MRGGLLFSFTLLAGFCSQGSAQDVVSASSGLLHYFEGAVILDDKPVEHKAAVFSTVKNGSTIHTEKGRAELLLTPDVYLRIDENSSLHMISNSLTDTRLEITKGAAILDSLNGNAASVVVVYDGSEVRFPKPGIYRVDCDMGELQVYSGESNVTHHGASTNVDSSHLYYFGLELTINKLDDGMMDEFYDWAHNRSDVIADQKQMAAAEQDPQDLDPAGGSGMFVVPPLYSPPLITSPSLSSPTLGMYGGTLYGSTLAPFYVYPPAGLFPYGSFTSVVILPPWRHRPGGSKWPGGSSVLGGSNSTGGSVTGAPVITRWPTRPPQGITSYYPGTGAHYPVTGLRLPITGQQRYPISGLPNAGAVTHYPAGASVSRPILTPAPRPISPSLPSHIAVPHAAAGRR